MKNFLKLALIAALVVLSASCKKDGFASKRGEPIRFFLSEIQSKGDVITDDNRIVAALPTIKYLVANGAKTILLSHLGKVDYKKTEEEMTPDEIWAKNALDFSFPMSQKIVSFLGIPMVQIGGHEADDIIYFLARYLRDRYNVSVFSDDYDYIQMINLGVNVVRPMKGDIITPERYKEMFPFPIEYFVYYKSMIGDKSDNIPGIGGVGEKTASKILVDVCKENPENILLGINHWGKSGTTKKHKSVIDNFPILKRNLQLVDISMMEDFSELYINEYEKAVREISPDLDRLKNLFKILGFTSHSNWYPFCIEQSKKVSA